MRKEFVPLTARVIRRKPWARGKKSRTERKDVKPGKVELIGDPASNAGTNDKETSRIVSGVMNEARLENGEEKKVLQQLQALEVCASERDTEVVVQAAGGVWAEAVC